MDSGHRFGQHRIKVQNYKLHSCQIIFKKEELYSAMKHISILNTPSGGGGPIKRRLTLEVLHSLTPYQHGYDVVTEKARAMLVDCVKMEPSVHEIFFPTAASDVKLIDLCGFPFAKLAAALVAKTILQTNGDQKFHQFIDKNVLDNTLDTLYNSVYYKKLGFYLYTKLYVEAVRDGKRGVCFKDFIDDDGHKWAQKLLRSMMDNRWSTVWSLKIKQGICSKKDFDMEMNDLFVKLHLLDPQTVLPAFQSLVKRTDLPTVNLALATRNYLGGPLDCVTFLDEVRTAIRKTSVPVYVPCASLRYIELYCDLTVDKFIVTECQNLGICKERTSERETRTKKLFRCCIM